MITSSDPLFEADETRAAIGLQRWRADAMMRELWRLHHNRTHWKTVIKASSEGSSAVVVGGGSTGYLKAAYLEVVVAGHTRLGIEDHQLRVWKGTLRRVWRDLKPHEDLALESYLLQERHSSVFLADGPYVQKGRGTSDDLARAALKLMAAAEVKVDDRG
jgi:hypothetical protein